MNRREGKTPLGFYFTRSENLDFDYKAQTPKYARPMKWTTEPPTKEGWYWVYSFHERHPYGPTLEKVETHIVDGWLGVNHWDELEPLEEFIKGTMTHWLGPLPVPEPPAEGE